MKKLFFSIAAIIISLVSFAVAVSAATKYPYTKKNQDFTKSYKYTYASGNVAFEYAPKSRALWWTEYAYTRAGGFMKINEPGYFATTIITVDGQKKSVDRGVSASQGGWEYCGKAYVKGQSYAKHAEYYADFRTGSNTIDKIYTLQVD
ncbi:MAG: hypothetical protein NC223_07460 [Butyrivibrio sp.]|nr:hypothetical protein [Butyrivibrio sp.]